MLWLFIFLWLLAGFGFLFNLSMFLTGDTYDYQTRQRTYRGTKTILFGISCLLFYHLPIMDFVNAF